MGRLMTKLQNKHLLNEGWRSMADPVDPDKTLIFRNHAGELLLSVRIRWSLS